MIIGVVILSMLTLDSKEFYCLLLDFRFSGHTWHACCQLKNMHAASKRHACSHDDCMHAKSQKACMPHPSYARCRKRAENGKFHRNLPTPTPLIKINKPPLINKNNTNKTIIHQSFIWSHWQSNTRANKALEKEKKQ